MVNRESKNQAVQEQAGALAQLQAPRVSGQYKMEQKC